MECESDWPTLLLNTSLFTGKYYYEVEMVDLPADTHGQIGWATLEFLPDIALVSTQLSEHTNSHNEQGHGVGDDEYSWGLDTSRHTVWHGHTHLTHQFTFKPGLCFGPP